MLLRNYGKKPAASSRPVFSAYRIEDIGAHQRKEQLFFVLDSHQKLEKGYIDMMCGNAQSTLLWLREVRDRWTLIETSAQWTSIVPWVLQFPTLKWKSCEQLNVMEIFSRPASVLRALPPHSPLLTKSTSQDRWIDVLFAHIGAILKMKKQRCKNME